MISGPAIVARDLELEDAKVVAKQLSSVTGLSFALMHSQRRPGSWGVRLTQNHPDYRLRRWCAQLGGTLLKVHRVVREARDLS